MTSEVALLAPISMVCMLRYATALVRKADKPEDVDIEMVKKPLVLKACRRMLKTSNVLLEKHAGMGTVSTLLNFLRVDLPYTYLTRHLLQISAHLRPEEDKALLDTIAQKLATLALDIVVLKPLARATYRLKLNLGC